MVTISDKYQFKNIAKKRAEELAINSDFFERLFAPVFLEIFEREQQAQCVLKIIGISIVQQIVSELNRIGKKNKSDFLLLFEDYQRINSELAEIVIRKESECSKDKGNCTNCILDFSQYPYLCSRTDNIDLKTFRPEQVLTPQFLKFVEDQFGKHGLFFLYNINQELMYIGKSENLGSTMLDSIWEKNINGYASIALTDSCADIHIYEPYYILRNKPLLNVNIRSKESVSLEFPLLHESELVKIFER